MIRTIHFDHNEKRGVLRAVLGLLNERVQFSVVPEGCGWRVSYPVPPAAPTETPQP